MSLFLGRSAKAVDSSGSLATPVNELGDEEAEGIFSLSFTTTVCGERKHGYAGHGDRIEGISVISVCAFACTATNVATSDTLLKH